MKYKTLVITIAFVSAFLFFALVPFVHNGAVGPTSVSSQPGNQVYVSLSCVRIGLGTVHWGSYYEFGCVPVVNGDVLS